MLFLDIVRSAAISMAEQVPAWFADAESCRFIPRSDRAGAYGSSILELGKPLLDFHSDYASTCSQQQGSSGLMSFFAKSMIATITGGRWNPNFCFYVVMR